MLRFHNGQKRFSAAAWVIALALNITLTGCDSDPKAPVLRDAPFYHNKSEGIRFIVPEGWKQTASALLPQGDFDDEVYLVRYSLTTPESGAMMVVLVMQEKTPVNLEEHLAGPSFRVQKWTVETPSEEIEVNGSKLEHFVFTAKVGERSMTKDVYCFRRNSRIYSFLGLYWTGDHYAEQQIERAVKSLERS